VNDIPSVGTRFGAIGKLFGGLFGAGGRPRIEEMYEALVQNWKAGQAPRSSGGACRICAELVPSYCLGDSCLARESDRVGTDSKSLGK
jgi:hypothetical protein